MIDEPTNILTEEDKEKLHQVLIDVFESKDDVHVILLFFDTKTGTAGELGFGCKACIESSIIRFMTWKLLTQPRPEHDREEINDTKSFNPKVN